MKKIRYTFRGWGKRKIDGNYLILNKSNVQLYCDIMNEKYNNSRYQMNYDVNYWNKYIYFKHFLEPTEKEEFIKRAEIHNNNLQFNKKFNQLLK